MLIGRNIRPEDEKTFKRLSDELANQFYFFEAVLVEDIYKSWLQQKEYL